VKKTANFRAAVWFLAGMQLHWFCNQNWNWGLDWTNYKLRTNVNSDTFLPPFPFKWNGVFCPKWRVLSKTTSFHTLFIYKKKKPETVPFWTALWVFFFPWTRETGEKYFFLPLFSLTSLPLKHQKDADQGPLLAQNFPRVGGVAA